MKTIEELTGYDKAAIIYDILGDSVAINMFKDIPEAELYELRKHASKIKREVSIRVKKDVLDDYYFKMLSAEKDKQISLNEVKNSLKKRNQLDINRRFSPLIRTKDSIIIRTDILSKKEMVNKMSKEIDKKL